MDAQDNRQTLGDLFLEPLPLNRRYVAPEVALGVDERVVERHEIDAVQDARIEIKFIRVDFRTRLPVLLFRPPDPRLTGLASPLMVSDRPENVPAAKLERLFRCAVLKNMLKTLLILIGILIMVAFFGFAIMMVFHASLFGYTYVRYEKDASVEFTAAEVASLTTIDLTTAKADIVIGYTASEDRETMLVSNLQDFQGVFKDDVQRVDYTDPDSEEKQGGYTLKIEGGVLKIETIEPQGLYFRNENVIKIFLPQSKHLPKLIIDSGARNINIGNSKEFSVDELTIVAEKNKFINNVQISDKLTINNNLKLKTNLGKI